MSAVREWAQANGLPVGKRGRISQDVFVAYLEGNPSVARAFLKDHGVVVGKRGRISKAAIRQAVK
jgi:hypothetical protein